MILTDDLTHKLFPNTPVVVAFEDGEYHVYTEGLWHSRHQTMGSVALQLDELLAMHGDDWLYECTRVNPNWEGWAEVSFFELLANVVGEE